MRDEIVERRRASRIDGHDHRAASFAPFVVGQADDGDIADGGMVHEDGTYSTHAWVQTELGAALGSELQYILEVRETDLEDQGNIVNDRQRLIYDETRRDAFLVELIDVLSRWSRGVKVELTVLPEEISREIAPYVMREPARFVLNVPPGSVTWLRETVGSTDSCVVMFTRPLLTLAAVLSPP